MADAARLSHQEESDHRLQARRNGTRILNLQRCILPIINKKIIDTTCTEKIIYNKKSVGPKTRAFLLSKSIRSFGTCSTNGAPTNL